MNVNKKNKKIFFEIEILVFKIGTNFKNQKLELKKKLILNKKKKFIKNFQ